MKRKSAALSAIYRFIGLFFFSDLPDASIVHGLVTEDGLFDGHISTPVEDYYIEPASRYFTITEAETKRPPFHSVIYKASDVVHPNALPTTASQDYDGLHEVYIAFISL